MISPRNSPRGVAPRGAIPIDRRAYRRAGCSRAAIPVRDRREATGKARMPVLRPRPAIGASSRGASSPPPPASSSTSTSAPTSSSSSSSSPSPAELVDALLASVAGASADRGSSMSSTERAAADELFDRLARAAEAERGTSSSSSSSLSPLDSPFLLGDFDVAYVSTGGKQKGQPAGGRFRSGLGKALFATTALCQSIFYEEGAEKESGEKPPLLVTNKVAFRLAGVVEGSVGLRGRVTAAFPSSDWKRAEGKEGEGEAEGGTRGEERKGKRGDELNDAVRVDFDPAVISILPKSKLFRLFLRIGRPSWVALATPYVDERVRLGVGSLGSRFLFTRGGEAARQGMRLVGAEAEDARTGAGARAALASLAAGLLCASAALLGAAWRCSGAVAALAASVAAAPAASAAAVSALLLPAARAAAALGAALLCGVASLAVLRAATGTAAAAPAGEERERVGPGGLRLREESLRSRAEEVEEEEEEKRE